MKSTATKFIQVFGLVVVIGLAIAAGGIYVGETDDAPGAALLGILVLIAAITLAARIAFRATH